MPEQRNRSQAFGRLLSGAINSIATYEGKTAPVIEDELGALAVVSGKTIQRYKAGHIPPEQRTVEILAEAAVKRGFLGRAWLQRFLHAARYPGADQLLDRLCPAPIIRARAPRVYANLPAPTYSQFVMRAQAFAEVCEGLAARSAAVLIVGLGGQGKTSLAREVADACLKGAEGAPTFDAAVWVSDKDRPGTTNLSTVLDEIARTLDYPGFTQFEHDEKRREVEQLLRKQRVLLVVDNFETVTDGALLSWLLRLPEPSKALITSREYRREWRSSWPAELRGMTEAEAQALITQRMRMLQLDKKVKDATEFEPLVAVTGGNPKAIEIALGLVKHERRPLQQVVDDLYAARGELFDDLFTRAWALLTETERQVLLVMTFFLVSAGGEALSVAAAVEGFAFDQATARLADLALFDVQQGDLTSAPRYTLHPLVRAFARAELVERPLFEVEARERWLGWHVQLASRVGYCWNDLRKLEQLDPEQETVHAAVGWALQHQRYVETIQLAKGVDYHYLVRGLWDKKLSVNLMHAEAARAFSDPVEEAAAIAYNVQMLCKRENAAEAEKLLPRLTEIAQSNQLSGDMFSEFQHAVARYWVAQHDLDAAQQAWQTSFSRAKQLSAHMYVMNSIALAVCLYQKGMGAEAQQLFRESLQSAVRIGYQRYIYLNQCWLAAIDIDQGDLEGATEKLEASSVQAHKYQDRESVALIQRLYARLHTLRGDLLAARAALTEAIDLFERLGMRRELAEARAALADLEARERAETVG